MNHYETITADSHQDAIDGSKYKIGSLCKVVDIKAIANGNGTWHVTPIVEPIEKPARVPFVSQVKP